MSNLYRRWIDAILSHPARAGAILILLAIPAVYFSALYFMNVKAGLEDLLPKDAKSVRDLEELHDRIGGVANFIVIAHGQDGEENRRFIGELGHRLDQKKLPEAKSIRYDVTAERKWIEAKAALLLDADRFDDIMERVEGGINDAKKKANPLLVDLEEKKDDQSGWKKLESDLEKESVKQDRFPRGFLETKDGSTVVLLIALNGSEVDIGPAAALAQGVEAEVAAIRGHYSAGLTVAYTGEVQNMIEEHDAILADVGLSSLLVFVLVGALIAVYFRSMRAILVVLGMLMPGLLFTFAIGRLSGSELNSNSAFLGSIIAGNGINYPLLMLAYYRARPASESMTEAILAAAFNALPGTLGAAATASAAYLGLAAATFRGFSEFGWLGGVGMLTTWLMTFAVAPLFVALLKPPRKGDEHTALQERLERYFAGKLAPPLVAGIFVVIALGVGAIGVKHAHEKGLYDMSLLNLRNTDSLKHGSASWDSKIADLFGVWLNPVMGMVDDPADREPTRAGLYAALVEGQDPMAERVETILKFAPEREQQQERIGRLRRLKRSLDAVDPEQIPEKARPYLDRWLAAENLRVITSTDVPSILRQGFTEQNGRSDRTVLLYPSLGIDYNDGHNILKFVERLEAAKVPKDAVVAGGFLFMAEIIRLIREEAPKVMGTVCLLVAVVLIPIFRRKPLRIPLVVGTVAVVAVSAQAVMFAAGVQLNMLNFAAVPITIGVGADYAVNLLGAMDAYSTDARRACARMGGAILLCSLTTIVGYLSLLLAHSGALRSFGWAAVLGEIMAVTTVLVVLPVLMPSKR
ncbi:MAG: MMPL family transporter [Myxococcota bacterium]